MVKCCITWKRVMDSVKAIAVALVAIFFRRNMAAEVDAFEENHAKSDCDCVICLCEIHEGEKWRRLPGCGHGFHTECIEGWLKDQSTCPLCRNNVPSSSSLSTSDLCFQGVPLVSCFFGFLKHLSTWFVNPLGLDLSSSSAMGF